MMASSEYIPVMLITGANQGIGFSTAQLLTLSPQPYHLLIGSRTLSRGHTAATTLHSLPSANPQTTHTAISLDITSPSSIAAAVSTTASSHKRLDVLINNAGIFLGGPGSPWAGKPQHELLRHTCETNVFGTAAVTEAFLPLLRQSRAPGGAKIVVLSSSLGSLEMAAAAPPHRLDISAYRVSKAAVNMLVVEWAKGLEKDGVRVWGVDPGRLSSLTQVNLFEPTMKLSLTNALLPLLSISTLTTAIPTTNTTIPEVTLIDASTASLSPATAANTTTDPALEKRGDIASFYFCRNNGFRAPCAWSRVPINQCMNFPQGWDDNINSFGPDRGDFYCVLHSNAGCGGGEPKFKIRYPGTTKTASYGIDGRVSSVRCSH
ncbi:NAD(P)-binding protein [Neofusicoccum parvum]|nr:NAD(P)-binding protein [Neofusicoccum parvum]